MTKNELKQYRSLKRNIEKINETISASILQISVKSSEDFPYCKHNVTVSGIQPGDYGRACTLKDRKATLKAQCKAIEQFVDDIADSQLRLIFKAYYIDGTRRVSWQSVAEAIGESDEQYPRRKHNKYLCDFNKT